MWQEAGLRELTAGRSGKKSPHRSVVLGVVRLCANSVGSPTASDLLPQTELGVRTIGKLPQRDPCTPGGQCQAHLGISRPSSWSPWHLCWLEGRCPTSLVSPSPGPQKP